MGAVVCSLYAAHLASWLTVPGLDAAELLTVDARLKIRGPRPPMDGSIVIVGFDDDLRRRHPETFQQRAGWARFIDKLQGYEPKAVAIDAFFSSPEIPLPTGVVAKVRKAHAALTPAEIASSKNVALAHKALQAVVDATNGDRLLAAAVKRGKNIVLGLLFFVDNGESAPLPVGEPEPVGLAGARFDEGVALENPKVLRPVRAESGVYASLPQIATATRFAGTLNVLRDSDGKVRRLPGAVEQGGRFYAAIGLAVARIALGGVDLAYVAGERSMKLGDTTIPCDTRGILHVNPLAGRGAFKTISAAAVIDGSVKAEDLRGKLVFVGYTDAARDQVSTALADAIPGVELHATLAHNVLHDELLRPGSPKIALGGFVLLALLLTLSKMRAVRRRRSWLGSVLALAAIGAWLVIAQVAMNNNIIIEVAGPVIGLAIIALGTLTVALATEGREKARLRRAFGQYVARSLVDRIADDPSRVRLGGVRRELTVLFSDIRGFSAFSEGMKPETLSSFLNEYLTPMSDVVLHHSGMLDKFIGDAVMAVYGAPLPMQEHAEEACATALQMIGRLDDLNADWRARGLPEIKIGVGLNSGEMSVGNMGSEQRFDYTVIGDEVNLAARLEALTKEYRTGILCGPRTAELAGASFIFRELDVVRVKGRRGRVKIFDLVARKGSAIYTESWLRAYQEALAAYRIRDWEKAARGFAQLREKMPDDGPTAMMLERIDTLRADPPGDDWDGVYEQVSK